MSSALFFNIYGILRQLLVWFGSIASYIYVHAY